MSLGKETLDKIQKEIKDSLQREDELKNNYSKLKNGNLSENNTKNNDLPHKHNDSTGTNVSNGVPKSNGNGFRKFIPNTTTKGVMQKFFKSRGKVNQASLKTSETQNLWISDAALQPAKLTIEKGKPLRNGYVPAEEKIVKELQEFQIREEELRKERRKSQPNLMAALELQENSELKLENGFSDNRMILKQAKSMANLYNTEDETLHENHSAPCSLKPARSLAALCDISDDEVEIPGTYSLIMQFESMKTTEARP